MTGCGKGRRGRLPLKYGGCGWWLGATIMRMGIKGKGKLVAFSNRQVVGNQQ